VNLDWHSIDIPYSSEPEFLVVARETVDRVIGMNTFMDMGRLCVGFL